MGRGIFRRRFEEGGAAGDVGKAHRHGQGGSGAGDALLWWCVLFCCRYWYSTGRARVGDALASVGLGSALARCFVCELDLGSTSTSRSKAGRKEFPSRES